jgi:FAD/FMN-containing dehydrogenase
MKTLQKLVSPDIAAARGLRAMMQDKVALRGDAGYEQARAIWNGAIAHQPAVIVRCENSDEVRAAVRAARSHQLPLSVRGGGHDWVGRALCHDGLVVDISAMRHVAVDPVARIAIIGGGARVADVMAATAPHGLVAIAGNCGGVGMAGLTLGGGYGPLLPRFGLAIDQMLGAEIVLADGRHITVNAAQHTELFWALRGGGGNFGVVTSIRVRLHPVRQVLAGLMLFPWSEATIVLQRYAALARSVPDELAVSVGMVSGADGAPALFLAPAWCGELAAGEPMMDRLKALGSPFAAQVGPMRYADLLALFDAEAVNGRHHALQTRWLPDLSSDAIAALVAAGSKRTSRRTMIALHHFRGAPTRIAADATAFGMRREHVMVQIDAAWDPDDQKNAEVHREWARGLSRALAPSALTGGYANLLAPDQHDQIADAYGANLNRLRQVKRRFDPENIFSAIPLPPGPLPSEWFTA